MTKSETVQAFLERCGGAVYAAASVPDDAEFPYTTYEMQTAAYGDGEVPITVNAWFYTSSETVPDAYCDKLSSLIGRGGVMLPCDGGAVWIKRGSPFAHRIKNTGEDTIKRRYINLSAEFFTED